MVFSQCPAFSAGYKEKLAAALAEASGYKEKLKEQEDMFAGIEEMMDKRKRQS